MTDANLRLAARAAGLGAVAGLRSMMGPALASHAAAAPDGLDLEHTQFERFGHAEIAFLLAALSVGETIGDKVPWTPARTQIPSVIFRALSGALVGAMLFAAEGNRRDDAPAIVQGAIAGALGSLIGTFGGYHVRRVMVKTIGIPDFLVAVGEDSLALQAGRSLLRS